MNKNLIHTNESGRSMVEMLGVLAIVGVLSVGGIAGYSKAMNKFKTNKLIEQVNMISTNVRTLYASQKSYDGLTNGAAIRTGVLPNEMVDVAASQVAGINVSQSTSGIVNAFAGQVIITTGGVKEDGDDGAFIISMDKIPEAACVAIATTEWGGDAGGGLLAMSIESGADMVDDAADALKEATLASGTGLYTISNGDLPVAVTSAAAVCSGTENAIAWKYM